MITITATQGVGINLNDNEIKMLLGLVNKEIEKLYEERETSMLASQIRLMLSEIKKKLQLVTLWMTP